MTILDRVGLFLRATQPEPPVGFYVVSTPRGPLRFSTLYDPKRFGEPRPHGVLWKDGHWNVIEGEEFS